MNHADSPINEHLQIITFPVMPLGCNCSILSCRHTKEAVIIDPGGEGPKITAILEDKGYHVRWIIHTHAHFDHCLATHDVAQYCRENNNNPSIGLHPADMFLYENLAKQCQWFGLEPVSARENIDLNLGDEMLLPIGKNELKVIHTPGHTPGSCCFSIEEAGLLLSGDTLFAGGIGRTDLPGGDSEAILKSIKQRLFSLDDGTKVIPGHGALTQIYDEKRMNPFF